MRIISAIRRLDPVGAQELCESRGGRPGLPSLIYLRFLWTSTTDPILSVASLDVLEATRHLCLKTLYCLATISCSKLFQSMAVLVKKEYLWVSGFDQSFGTYRCQKVKGSFAGIA